MFSRHTRNVPWPNLRQDETAESQKGEAPHSFGSFRGLCSTCLCWYVQLFLQFPWQRLFPMVTVENSPQPSTWGPCCRWAGGGEASFGFGGHCWGHRWSAECRLSAAGWFPIGSAPRTEPPLCGEWDKKLHIEDIVIPRIWQYRRLGNLYNKIRCSYLQPWDGWPQHWTEMKEGKVNTWPCNIYISTAHLSISHRQFGSPVVIHHVQQWVGFPQHIDTHNIIKAQTVGEMTSVIQV